MKFLKIGQNPVSALDFSNNPETYTVQATGTKLTEFKTDGLINLYDVYLGGDTLQEVEIKNSPQLRQLYFANSPNVTKVTVHDSGLGENGWGFLLDGGNCTSLSEIDLRNIDIEGVDLNDCNFSTIDLSEFNRLRNVNLSNNPLVELTLGEFEDRGGISPVLDVSNTKLRTLSLYNLNELVNFKGDNADFEELDFSYCTKISGISLTNNESLTSLNIATGANSLDKPYSLKITGNANLSCVQIDDGFTPPEMEDGVDNRWQYETTTTFSTNCD